MTLLQKSRAGGPPCAPCMSTVEILQSGRAVRSIAAMTLARWQDRERLKVAGPSSLANPWTLISVPGLRVLVNAATRAASPGCRSLQLTTNRNCQPITDALLGAQSGTGTPSSGPQAR